MSVFDPGALECLAGRIGASGDGQRVEVLDGPHARADDDGAGPDEPGDEGGGDGGRGPVGAVQGQHRRDLNKRAVKRILRHCQNEFDDWVCCMERIAIQFGFARLINEMLPHGCS